MVCAMKLIEKNASPPDNLAGDKITPGTDYLDTRHYDTQIATLEVQLKKLTGSVLICRRRGDESFGQHYLRRALQPNQGTTNSPKPVPVATTPCSKTTPGIGEHLGLTLLHEIGDIQRFPSVKDFVSYCRLVKGTAASAGKFKGLRGAKLGNPYLRWAFGEAVVIAKRDPAVIGPLAQRLEARMNGNKFKANTVLAIKLARAVYFMLRSHTVFNPERLVAALTHP